MQNSGQEKTPWYKMKRLRLLLVDEQSLQEKVALTIKPKQWFIMILLGCLMIMVLSWALILGTPMRHLVNPAQPESSRQELKYLTAKVKEMEQTIRTQNFYILRIRSLISGQPVEHLVDSIELKDVFATDFEPVDRVDADGELRERVEERSRSKAILAESNTELPASDLIGINGVEFFVPVQGDITKGFDWANDHFGTDIVAPKNTAIKAILDGQVIFADWSRGTGYTICIQHEYNLVSMYKHNSALLKELGDRVEAGEAISIIGNTGENTNGPHVHFEIWHKGVPVDATEYIKFN